MSKKPIYIIGAGISGLIAAYELEQKGYSPHIIERTPSVGGRVKSIKSGDYTLDLGFQVLLDAYPLVNKYLNKEALELTKLAPGSLIYFENNKYLIGDPTRQLNMLFPTLFAKVGSFGDKLKILKLNRVLKKKSIEDIFNSEETTTFEYLQDFGFSNRMIERFFRPFFSGIFLEAELRTSSRMFEFVYKMFGEGHATIPKKGIGEISNQLKTKLKNTNFQFNTAVEKVDGQSIYLENGEIISHEGLIIATDPAPLIENLRNQRQRWKSCYCLYYSVDQTNIPAGTIALITAKDKYANNLYAYTDENTGKNILSVTVVSDFEGTENELAEIVFEEVKNVCEIKEANFIESFRIRQALPDIDHLRNTAFPNETEVLPKVYLAGDYLLNGSLNAAMESGAIAAQALIASEQGVFE